jgi:hypothetical protein
MFQLHLRKSRRFLFITTLIAVAALVFAAAAYATGASISPETQVGHSGVAVGWTGMWSGTSPFDVFFYYGDAGSNTHLSNTSSTSHNFSHTYFNCVDTVYDQTLEVTDHLGLNAGAESEVQVLKGTIC